MDPKVDDDDHREDIDGLVALLGPPGHPEHPDRARDQPRNLEQDVDWNKKQGLDQRLATF